MGGEIYTKRENFFFPYLLPGASGCQRLHPLASSSETPQVSCVSLAQLRFSVFCLNLTVWFSSCDLLPVTDLFDLSALITLSWLLIKMRQLPKAHWVTRNERKFHGICYIIKVFCSCFMFCKLLDVVYLDCYFTLLKVFHTAVSWWLLTGVCVRASHLKFRGLFSLFWWILLML